MTARGSKRRGGRSTGGGSLLPIGLGGLLVAVGVGVSLWAMGSGAPPQPPAATPAPTTAERVEALAQDLAESELRDLDRAGRLDDAVRTQVLARARQEATRLIAFVDQLDRISDQVVPEDEPRLRYEVGKWVAGGPLNEAARAGEAPSDDEVRAAVQEAVRKSPF